MLRLVTFGAVLLFVPLAAFAALIPTQQKFMTIDATPEYAGPQALVTLRANTVGVGEIGAYRWLIDGKVVQEGVGQDRITVKNGDIGSVTRVTVQRVSANNQDELSAEYILRPAEVDLLWEGDTYTPPFFSGRPLANQESTILLKAVPFFTSTVSGSDAASLVYQWALDGKARPDLSGYGKSSATVRPPFFSRPFRVSVSVSTLDGTIAAKNEVLIRPVPAVAMIYEHNPLLNILFNRALSGTASLKESEATLRAYPLYANFVDDITFTWTLNGAPVAANATNPREATFRKTGTGSGAFSIGVRLTSPVGTADNAETSFMLSL